MKKPPFNDKIPPGVESFCVPDDDSKHDGHFTLPGGGGVASFADVIAQPDFHGYIRTYLTSYPKSDPICQGTDAITRIFVPGLNTPVLELEGTGEVPAPERLDHYVRVTGLPFAQIANGSQLQQPPISVIVNGQSMTIPSNKIDWIQAARERSHRASRFLARLAKLIDLNGDGSIVKWNISMAVAALHGADRLGTPNLGLRQSLEALILAQLEAETPPHLELMTYSESTIVLGGVLVRIKESYLDRQLKRDPKQKRWKLEQNFDHLVKERITLATFGNGFRNFPMPFRFVHFYAVGDNPDVLTKLGSSGPLRNFLRKISNFGYEKALTFEQPYKGFDSHNFAVAGASAVRLYLEKNSATSFKDLHALFRGKIWPKINRPTEAEIGDHAKKSESERYLWNPKEALA